MVAEWWQDNRCLGWLNQALEHVNRARGRRQPPVEECRALFEGLNALWSAHSQPSGSSGPVSAGDHSDHQAVRELLNAIPANRQAVLCNEECVRMLARLTPQIENHKVLRESPLYRPGQPTPPKVRKKATAEHRKLLRALQQCEASSTEETRGELIKRLADLLYVVRSNIAHGEKTPERARDTQVCNATRPVLDEVFEAILDRPSQRLVLSEVGPVFSAVSSSDRCMTVEVLFSAGVPDYCGGERVKVVEAGPSSVRVKGIPDSDCWRALLPVKCDGTDHIMVVSCYYWRDLGLDFIDRMEPPGKGR